MNKAEAIKLAKETGCGLSRGTTSAVFFYCQEDEVFKFLLPTSKISWSITRVDMDAHSGNEWHEVDRPVQASKFTSLIGKTLGDLKHYIFHDYDRLLKEVNVRISIINGMSKYKLMGSRQCGKNAAIASLLSATTADVGDRLYPHIFVGENKHVCKLDNVSIRIGGKVMPNAPSFCLVGQDSENRRNHVFDSMTYTLGVDVCKDRLSFDMLPFEHALKKSGFLMDSVKLISSAVGLSEGEGVGIMRDFMNGLDNPNIKRIVVNSRRCGKKSAWEEMLKDGASDIQADMYSAILKTNRIKEEKMKKVILKSGHGVEWGFDSKVEAEKWIQENGEVREKFVMYKNVGTYSVPAPKLEKIKNGQ